MFLFRTFTFLVIASLLVLPTLGSADDYELTKKDLIALNGPGVIRIMTESKGEVTIKPFKFDFEKIQVLPDATRKKIVEKFDVKSFGTGFIISPNGYILTNAHVVSAEMVRAIYVMEELFMAIFKQALKEGLGQDDTAEIEARIMNMTDEEGIAFTKEVFKYVVFEEVDTKVTVLNPSSSGSRLEDILKSGYPAEVVGMDDDFLFNDKDVAIIKIDAEKLPALTLAEDSDVSVGDEVFTFGFPASADFGSKNILEPSFTEGTVSAKKNSIGGEFKLIQTDAKISQGSSGSPLFNKEGDVIAVVTAQSGDQLLGDNFAFGIPIEVAASLMSDKTIFNTGGEYQEELYDALMLKSEKRCKKAIEGFEAAKEKGNSDFVQSKVVDNFIDQCEAMIEDGESIDSYWDEVKHKIVDVGGVVWLIILGSILGIVILIFVILRLIKRIRRGRKRVDALEDLLVRQKVTQGQASPMRESQNQVLPKEQRFQSRPIESTPIPKELSNYVISMRSNGTSDDVIREQLKDAGWEENMINQVLV